MKNEYIVECKDVVRRFDNGSDFIAVKNVSFVVKKGEFIALTGKSGSGKSTLMNMIGLIDSASSGKIMIAGTDTENMSSLKRAEVRCKHIGYIFQSFYLENKYTVYKNIEMPLLILGVPKSERKKRISECMKFVNIEHKADQLAETLSGGEKQRVCIARALANDPELILADEPCGNLDSVNTGNVMNLLSELKKKGKTILMVTHSAEDAAYADRIITLKDGEIIHESD